MINKQSTGGQKEDILYTRVVKAGKRIYYIDVKKNSRGDMYLALTESKKVPRVTLRRPISTTRSIRYLSIPRTSTSSPRVWQMSCSSSTRNKVPLRRARKRSAISISERLSSEENANT